MTTEAKTTEAPEAPEADAKGADQIEAEADAQAAKMLQSMFGVEPSEDEPHVDEEAAYEPAEEPEEAPEADEAADADGEEEAPEAEASKPRREERDPEEEQIPAWKRGQIARKEKQVERRFAELEQQKAALESREKELDETVQQIRGLAGKLSDDPQAAIDDFARMAGLRGQDVIRDLAHRMMNGKPDPKAAEASAVAKLEQQIAELKKELSGQSEKAAKTWEERQRQQFVQSNIADLLEVKTNPDFGAKWEHMAACPEARLKREVEETVAWAAKERPDLLGAGLPRLADLIETCLREEFDAFASVRAKRQNARRAPDSDPEEPTRGAGPPKTARTRGSGTPATPAKLRKRNPQSLTNGDGARQFSEMSEEDRDRAAAEALRGGLGMS